MRWARLGDKDRNAALNRALADTQEDAGDKQHGDVLRRSENCGSGDDEHHTCDITSALFVTAMRLIGMSYVKTHLIAWPKPDRGCRTRAVSIFLQIDSQGLHSQELTIMGPIQKLAHDAMDMAAKISLSRQRRLKCGGERSSERQSLHEQKWRPVYSISSIHDLISRITGPTPKPDRLTGIISSTSVKGPVA